MNFIKILGLLLWLFPFADGLAAPFSQRQDVREFIAEMAGKHGFDAGELKHQFSQVKPRSRIVRAMTGQFVKAPDWQDYRGNFVNPRSVARGMEFWEEHAATLARASQTYGVPEEIIVSILNVETRFGKFPMPYRALDSLSTLAFNYPRRAAFFRGELEDYLLLMREEKYNPLAVKGSFAGALGIPQFMPSNYRKYAVDFDGDGKRNLLNSAADAIGSVANYLKSHGWAADEPVAMRAWQRGEAIPAELATGGLKPERPVEEWLARQIEPDRPLPPSALAALFAVESGTQQEYWLGLNNFYVISRYNRSLFYALAVHQLGEEIRAARLAGDSEPQ
jgi:membrane-bound lytic murein transglycosylase B